CAPMGDAGQQQAGARWDALDTTQQDQIGAAMHAIETLFAAQPKIKRASKARHILREPKIGDFGWIVPRHAELYAKEYGWTEPFEGLCAQIVADFVNNFDPKLERCWIAEIDGTNVGCVMLVKD